LGSDANIILLIRLVHSSDINLTNYFFFLSDGGPEGVSPPAKCEIDGAWLAVMFVWVESSDYRAFATALPEGLRASSFGLCNLTI
jgi:hypothetical protein